MMPFFMQFSKDFSVNYRLIEIYFMNLPFFFITLADKRKSKKKKPKKTYLES